MFSPQYVPKPQVMLSLGKWFGNIFVPPTMIFGQARMLKLYSKQCFMTTHDIGHKDRENMFANVSVDHGSTP